MLNFSTVREGDNRSLIEREVTLWNERDQAGWLALSDLPRLEATAPGGLHMSGQAAADAIWDTWNDAFPDNRLTTVSIHADDRGGVYEGRFVGTHSGSLRGPAGDIGPTGRRVDTWIRGRARVRRREDHQHAHLLRPDRSAGPARGPGRPGLSRGARPASPGRA